MYVCDETVAMTLGQGPLSANVCSRNIRYEMLKINPNFLHILNRGYWKQRDLFSV